MFTICSGLCFFAFPIPCSFHTSLSHSDWYRICRALQAHTTKRGKRYRYYISQRVIQDATTGSTKPGRIPARDLEQPVLVELKRFFASADEVVTYRFRTVGY